MKKGSDPFSTFSGRSPSLHSADNLCAFDAEFVTATGLGVYDVAVAYHVAVIVLSPIGCATICEKGVWPFFHILSHNYIWYYSGAC